MAKQMTSKLPSVEKAIPTTRPPVAQTAFGEAVTVPANVEHVVIELPIGPRSNGYLNERVNMHLTTQVQRVAMQRLRNGLIESRAVLKDGTKVANEQHAIRWLLESLPLS